MVAIKNAFSLTKAMPLPWTSAADMAAALNLLRQVSCHPTLSHTPHYPHTIMPLPWTSAADMAAALNLLWQV